MEAVVRHGARRDRLGDVVPADVFTGWIDVRLSDRGKQQAHKAYPSAAALLV